MSSPARPVAAGATGGLADAHVHLFPDADAGREWLVGIGVTEPRRDGTWEGYQRLMAGVTLGGVTALLHARAQTLLPDGVRPVDDPRVLERIRTYNDWGLTELRPATGAVVVIGVDPALMSEGELRGEIARGAAGGSAGVKLVPGSARLYLDEPRCLTVFEEAARHGLPVVVQSGNAGPVGERGHAYGRPAYLREALDALPDLSVVLAHFGEGYDGETVELARRHGGVYADLSMRLNGKPPESELAELALLIREFGPDRVMFGSNYPIADPARASASFHRLADHGLDLSVLGSTTWRRLFGDLTPAGRADA